MRNSNISLENARLDNRLLLLLSNNFDLDPLGRVTGSTEYYEIQYDDVPYKGPEGNLFYVEALGINSGGDSDSCSNVIYDLAQEE